MMGQPFLQKLRVCCFCEQWGSGGIEAFLYNVLAHMDRSALEIDLVVAALRKSIFTQPMQRLGVRFYPLSGSTRRILENYRLFRKLLEKQRYDILYLNAYHGLSLLYVKLAQEMGIPVRIAHSHNTALGRSFARPLKLAIHHWAKACYTKAATELWACSEPAAKYLFSPGALAKRGYTFIPNGIDMQRFRFCPDVREEMRKRLGLTGKLVVGHVGRLCYQKNQDFLLDVFYGVTQKRADSVLLLIGEGPDRPKLAKKAERLGIGGRVVFYGTSAKVEQLYWVMDAFVMPSRFEGLPVTGIEAQAAGLPCLFSAAITQECDLGNAIFLPLKAGPEYWAGVLLKSQGTACREGLADIAHSSFDIQAVAQKIRQKWVTPHG